jgi:hypothetical protein
MRTERIGQLITSHSESRCLAKDTSILSLCVLFDEIGVNSTAFIHAMNKDNRDVEVMLAAWKQVASHN